MLYIKKIYIYEYSHVPFGIGVVPAYPAATDFFKSIITKKYVTKYFLWNHIQITTFVTIL